MFYSSVRRFCVKLRAVSRHISRSEYSTMQSATLFDWVEEQGLVSLGVGAPDKTLLADCTKIMTAATQHLFSTGETDPLQYGAHFGDPSARRELAKFLTQQYGTPVNPDNIMFNAGATQGLKFLAGSLMEPGDTVYVEDPTYFIAITIMKKDLGLNVIQVPTDNNGVIVEELDRLMTENSGSTRRGLTPEKPYSSLVYLIPSFNNPRGTLLTEGRSTEIIKVLRKHKALAVCDDVYNVLYFNQDKPPPKRLLTYDKPSDPDYHGSVFSNCTFSKLLGPGLRLGWIEGPNNLLSMLSSSGYACSGGCFNHYTACVIGKALELGLVLKHVEHSRKVYHSRMTALCDAIDEFMPTAKYLRPEGGYFVWVVLPVNIEAQKVMDVCLEKYKVHFHIGSKCSSAGNFPNCIRLSCAYYPEGVLRESVRKIGLALDQVANSAN